jgi:hypothetical protein
MNNPWNTLNYRLSGLKERCGSTGRSTGRRIFLPSVIESTSVEQKHKTYNGELKNVALKEMIMVIAYYRGW